MSFRSPSPQDSSRPLESRFRLAPGQLEQGTYQAGPKTDAAALALQHRRRSTQRPAELIRAIGQLDAHAESGSLREVADWIKQEYEVLDLPDIAGFFQKCLLGEPYIDHTLSLGFSILDHHTRATRVPAPYDAARPLVRNPAYGYVEVYTDGTLIPVDAEGLPTVPESSLS